MKWMYKEEAHMTSVNYSPSIITSFNNQINWNLWTCVHFQLVLCFCGKMFFVFSLRKLFISNDVRSDTERHTFTWSHTVNLKTPVDRFAAFAAFSQPFRRHLNAALLPSYVNAAQTVEVIHGNRGAATNRRACPPHSTLSQTHTFRLCARARARPGWNAPWKKSLVTTSAD